ncbi:MAG: choice-of-anchor D domain-containing protein, partial [Candidatus Krumholzibacteria bacterium]|nr:choice-of-anchor D domain-containing protein [Candidatus Krumholzibacteria bacterium]
MDFNTEYFFAIKVYDEQENESFISNLDATGMTLGIPQLSYAPTSFSDSLATGGMSTQLLTIANDGMGTLDFSFSNLPSWLSTNPETGRVNAGENTTVEMKFDATGLPGGTHTAAPNLLTNDPAMPSVPINTVLLVTAAPDIAVAPESLDFGPHFTGTTVTEDVMVTNIGVTPLNVSGLSVDNPEFVVDPSGFVLAPSASRVVTVEFNPITIGPISGSLSISSDDPDTPVYTVPLAGEGVDPPVIVVTPTSLSKDLFTGGTATDILTVHNNGGSDLTFEIEIESVETAFRVETRLNIPPAGEYPRGTHAPSIGLAPANGVPTAPSASAPTVSSTGGSSFATNADRSNFVSLNLNLPEVLNAIGPAPDYIWAGDFALGDNSFAYALNDLNQFMQIDTTTGAQTILGTLTPFGGERFTGMAVDPTDGSIYMTSTNVGTSSLYLVDVGTVTATWIGPIGLPGIIAVAVDDQGEMYAHDIVTDELVRIDKTTGTGTAVGPLGYDANFGQGMAFDLVSGQLYLAAFNNATIQAELRIADRTTGATMLVGVLGSTVPGGTNQLGWIGVPVGAAPWL